MRVLQSLYNSFVMADGDIFGDPYSNILATHRGWSHITWALQTWLPSDQYDNGGIFPQGLPRDELIKLILKKDCFSKDKEKALAILTDIAHNHQLPWVRFAGMGLGKLMSQLYTSVNVHRQSVERLRTSVTHAPTVFIPTHRSYVDFLITPYLCFYYHLPLPLIAAGEDFKHMKGIGRLLRNCCAFYLRRTFRGNGDDDLYRQLFEEYVQCLLLDGSRPVEFFIEGTRSRSGKSLKPKYGLFTMMLDLYFSHQIHDINLVPIGLAYDRTLEENLHANELLGIPKPKESTSGFLKAIRSLQEQHGGIHVNFGIPISVHDFIVDSKNEATDCRRQKIQQLGMHVVQAQQDLLVVYAFPIVCAVGFDGIELSELLWKSLAFAKLLRKFGKTVRLESARDVLEAISNHSNLVTVDNERQVITFLRSSSESSESLEKFRPAMLRQYYVNQILHVLFNPVIFFLSYVCSQSPPKHVFAELLNLFSHDFLTTQTFGNTRDVVLKTGIFSRGRINTDEEVICLTLFRHLFQSYALVLDILLNQPSPGPLTQAFTLKQIVKLYQEKVLKHAAGEASLLSKELPLNCLKSLVDRGDVTPVEVQEEATTTSLSSSERMFKVASMDNLKHIRLLLVDCLKLLPQSPTLSHSQFKAKL